MFQIFQTKPNCNKYQQSNIKNQLIRKQVKSNLCLVLKRIFLTKINQIWRRLSNNNKQNKKINKIDEKIINQFINHCATIIQSHFRGYYQRKYYRIFLPTYKRLRQILYAGFIGWKVRRLMKLSSTQTKINKIKKLQANNQFVKMRILKRQFIFDFEKALKHSSWLQQAKKISNHKLNKCKFQSTKNLKNLFHQSNNFNKTQKIKHIKSYSNKNSIMETQKIKPNQNQFITQINQLNFDDIPIKVNNNNLNIIQISIPNQTAQQSFIPKKQIKPKKNSKKSKEKDTKSKSKTEFQNKDVVKNKCLTPTKKLEQFQKNKLNKNKIKIKITSKKLTPVNNCSNDNNSYNKVKSQEHQHLSIKELLNVYNTHYNCKKDELQKKIIQLNHSYSEYSKLNSFYHKLVYQQF